MPIDDPTDPDPGANPLDPGEGGKTPPPATNDDGADEGDPPANELQEWRRRALEAEALVEQLRAEIEALRARLAGVERTRAMDALLTDAGALDVDAARAVLDARLAQSPADASVDLASSVQDLKRALPFLFATAPSAPPPAPRPSAMSPALSIAPADDLDAALELAATSGDRAALLRYLRLRRAV